MADTLLDEKIANNFRNVKLIFLLPALFLFALFFSYFFIIKDGSNFVQEYVTVQKDLFFYLNDKLAKYPNIQLNLTQLGDILISFSFLSLFIVYAPKLWQALLTSSILTLLVCLTLKKNLYVPRPFKAPEVGFKEFEDGFNIIGKIHSGYATLPSGHSAATFTAIMILLFAFMPKKHKIIWSMGMISLGLIIAFSRVAVGAHFPLDILVGSTIGYILTIIGITISTKTEWLSWMSNKKYYPIHLLLLAVGVFLIIQKILATNLVVFYLALLSLLITIYIISKAYVQKEN